MRNIDAHYYGYMDDDDGLLIPIEEKCEKEAIRQKVEQWKANETNTARDDEVYDLPEMNVRPSNNIFPFVDCSFQSDDEDYVAGRSTSGKVDVISKDHVFIAHVPVPSQKDVGLFDEFVIALLNLICRLNVHYSNERNKNYWRNMCRMI